MEVVQGGAGADASFRRIGLELGGGSGNFKLFAPDAVSSDILSAPWLDVVCDAQRLPFSDQAFSNVVMIDVLHHVENPLRALRQACGVLRVGGRVIMCEPAITPLSGIFYRLASRADAVLTLLSTVSVLLAFTRATYLGLTLALLVVSGLWIRIPSPASVALKRFSLAGLAAVLALIITGGVHSLVKSGAPAQAVASRATATVADLQSGQGTVQYRYDLTKRMRRVLGSHWVEGLGFLHPDDHPVANDQFPFGAPIVEHPHPCATLGLGWRGSSW